MKIIKSFNRQLIVFFLLYMFIKLAFGIPGFLYINTTNQAAAQQLIAEVFNDGLQPALRSDGNNSARDFWNNLRAPLTYQSFFRIFDDINDLRAHTDSFDPLNGVIFMIQMDNNFYRLQPTLNNFQRILSPIADPDLSINRLLNEIILSPFYINSSAFHDQFIVGFNRGRIGNSNFQQAIIYQDNQAIGQWQNNQNFILPTTQENYDGFPFRELNDALDTSNIQVLPPRPPDVFERVVSFFVCGGSNPSHSNLVNTDIYNCSTPKNETIQMYNNTYSKSLDLLKINPNDNVFTLDNGTLNGLVRLVPAPLPNYEDHIIIIPLFVTIQKNKSL